MPSDQQFTITLQHHINSIKTQIESGKAAKSHEWNRHKEPCERAESKDVITWIDLQIAVMEMELERLERQLKEASMNHADPEQDEGVLVQ